MPQQAPIRQRNQWQQRPFESDNRLREKGTNTVHCEEPWRIPIPKGPPSFYHSCLPTTKPMRRLDANPPSCQATPESTQTGLPTKIRASNQSRRVPMHMLLVSIPSWSPCNFQTLH